MEVWDSCLHWVTTFQMLTYIQFFYSNRHSGTPHPTPMTYFTSTELFTHTFSHVLCFYNFSFQCLKKITLFFINILNKMWSNLLTYLSVHFSLAVNMLRICTVRSCVLEREVRYRLSSGHHIFVMQDHCWHCGRDRSHWHRWTVTLMPPWINWILM